VRGSWRRWGPGVDATWLGREVVINPSLHWGAAKRAQGPYFQILGLPRHGTLAEKVAVPAEQLAAKPGHLSWEEAAALPLAGLTAYRALFSRARVQAGELVLVSGIGGESRGLRCSLRWRRARRFG
jgi:zinc-binding alcohol dehydrogenase/oxidoreductase